MFKYFFSLLLFFSVSGIVYSQDMDQRSMGAKYKSVYTSMLNALTSGDVDMLDKYLAPDFYLRRIGNDSQNFFQ
jgi:hypothetical protein